MRCLDLRRNINLTADKKDKHDSMMALAGRTVIKEEGKVAINNSPHFDAPRNVGYDDRNRHGRY